MKTIIHIGQHKTGTTSIQKFLQDNREPLIQDGLYVPSSIAGYSHPSHFILNVYALANDRYSQKKNEIIAERGMSYLDELEAILKKGVERVYKDALDSNCDTVLWSNEGLYLLNSVSEYSKLKDLFSRHSNQIEIVCCFRDISYRESYYKPRKIKNQLPQYPESFSYEEPFSWLFDDERKKDLLSQVFDSCAYFPYDSNENVKAFMQTIGYGYIDAANYRLNVTV